MSTKEEILRFLSENKERLFKEFNLEKLGLFGSFSKKEENENSDIDLIVEFREGTKDLHDKKIQLRTLLKNKLHREVDIAREKYLKPYFKKQVLESTIYV